MAGTNQKIDIGGISGISVPENRQRPTPSHPTPFELKHSTNSRKSLLKGIGVGSLAKLEENVDPFLRAHFGPGKCVLRVRFLEAV